MINVNAIELMKRKYAILRKRSKHLRKVIPNSVIKSLKNTEKKMLMKMKERTEVKHECKYENIYHCALQKTGTQWIFDVLTDPTVYEYSGMTVEKFDIPRRKSQAHSIKSLNTPYKANTIVNGISGTYDNFVEDIPKNENSNAAFFVIRDPREMVVSWYFSTRDNHVVDKVSMLNVHRRNLKKRSKKEGLKYAIELFDWKGKFDVMRSWIDKGVKKNVKLLKFENLTKDSFATFRALFDFLDIAIPDTQLENLISAYSFEVLTGRKLGDENQKSHMRSGTSKSWKKHLDTELIDIFNSKARDIVKGYGYENK